MHKNLHKYGAPTSSDVAVLMIGDGCDIEPSNRDILLSQREGGIKKISELHPSYDPLHYVLLFPRGDDGWHADIPLLGSGIRKRVTQMQFYSYRLQIRNGIGYKVLADYISSILLTNMLKLSKIA